MTDKFSIMELILCGDSQTDDIDCTDAFNDAKTVLMSSDCILEGVSMSESKQINSDKIQ